MDSHVEVFVLADQRSEPTSRQKLTTFSGGLIGPSRLSGSCFNEHAHRPACAGRRRRYWPPARIHPRPAIVAQRLSLLAGGRAGPLRLRPRQ